MQTPNSIRYKDCITNRSIKVAFTAQPPQRNTRATATSRNHTEQQAQHKATEAGFTGGNGGGCGSSRSNSV